MVVPRDTYSFLTMDRGVQSESIQYNRVGSKDLSFVDMSKNPLILDGDLVIHVQLPYPRVRQIWSFRGKPIFFPPMDRVVQSESIQNNRVGSKDLNFVDISRNTISH